MGTEALANPGLAADETVGCSRFPGGPLHERQIFKTVGLRAIAGLDDAPVKIRHRPGYPKLPVFERSGNREPQTAESSLVNVDSVFPVDWES